MVFERLSSLINTSPYLHISGCAFVVLDKAIATFRLPLLRVPERLFIFLSFLGAWPSIIACGILFNHKISRRKRVFQFQIIVASGSSLYITAFLEQGYFSIFYLVLRFIWNRYFFAIATSVGAFFVRRLVSPL